MSSMKSYFRFATQAIWLLYLHTAISGWWSFLLSNILISADSTSLGVVYKYWNLLGRFGCLHNKLHSFIRKSWNSNRNFHFLSKQKNFVSHIPTNIIRNFHCILCRFNHEYNFLYLFCVGKMLPFCMLVPKIENLSRILPSPQQHANT